MTDLSSERARESEVQGKARQSPSTEQESASACHTSDHVLLMTHPFQILFLSVILPFSGFVRVLGDLRRRCPCCAALLLVRSVGAAVSSCFGRSFAAACGALSVSTQPRCFSCVFLAVSWGSSCFCVFSCCAGWERDGLGNLLETVLCLVQPLWHKTQLFRPQGS